MIVRQHTRSKPYEKQRLAMTDRLWNELVGLQCVAALERALSEPLYDPQFDDMGEEQSARIRESF